VLQDCDERFPKLQEGIQRVENRVQQSQNESGQSEDPSVLDLTLNPGGDLIGQGFKLDFFFLEPRAGGGFSGGCPLNLGRGHPHYLIGRPVGLAFVFIVGSTDGQLGLQARAAQDLAHPGLEPLRIGTFGMGKWRCAV
jgi:hypothetical protein